MFSIIIIIYLFLFFFYFFYYYILLLLFSKDFGFCNAVCDMYFVDLCLITKSRCLKRIDLLH